MNISKFKYFNLLFILLVSCAHIEAPSGGEGDKTPPLVESISIKNAQLNFNDSQIELEFNKYMNRNSVIENISISPKIKFTPKWSGKTLTISFNEKLARNTTYSLQILGNYKDYYNNSSTESFFRTFSTGNKIDTGKISGKILTNNQKSKIYIFAYDLKNKNKDSINYFTETPDYKTAVGTNRKFTIPALKDGKYRIIAVNDLDKNGLISAHKDSIGIATLDPIVLNSKTDDIYIIMSKKADNVKIDTVKKDKAKKKDINQAIDTMKKDTLTPVYMKVSGSINNFSNKDKLSLLFYNNSNKYITQIDKNGNYNIEKMLAGTYNIIIFVDANNNNKFDKGKLKPFAFCEKFYSLEQKLTVRKNWDITDFIIEWK